MDVKDPGALDSRGNDAALLAVTTLAALGTGSAVPEPAQVYEHLLEHVGALDGVRHVDLLLIGDASRICDALHRGPFGDLTRYTPRPSRGGTVVDWVLATQEPARASDVSAAIVGSDLCRWGVRGLAAVPVLATGLPAAVLAVGSDADDGPPAATITATEALAMSAGTLLALARARHEARRDPLTGCLNHGAMLERTEQELARAARSHRPVGCVLLDLDGFKGVNDDFGHVAGDLLLETVGRALVTAFRVGDLVARYGGDEFVILVPDADTASLQEAATRAGRVVRDLPLPAPWASRMRGRVHATVGADLSRPGDAAADLLSRADRALATGKRTGKDRVVVVDRRA